MDEVRRRALAQGLRAYADEIEAEGAPAPSILYVGVGYDEDADEVVRAFLQSAGSSFEVERSSLGGTALVRNFGPLTVRCSTPKGTLTETRHELVETELPLTVEQVLERMYGGRR